MNLATISGGAFYLKALAKSVFLVNKRMPINVFTGTSSGAIVAAISAILGVNKMWQIAKDIDMSLAVKSPFKEDGESIRIGAVLRNVFGKALVIQDIKPILSKIINEADFIEYKNNPKSPACYVLTANVDTGKRAFWNIKKLKTTCDLFDVLQASAHMQGMCEGVLLNGQLHWDGGQFDHQCGHLMLDHKVFCNLTGEKPIPIERVAAIYARPADWTAEQKNFASKHQILKQFRMVELDNIEKSLNDEYKINQLCLGLNIVPNNVFIPRILEGFYDNNPQHQLNLLTLTEQAVVNAFS